MGLINDLVKPVISGTDNGLSKSAKKLRDAKNWQGHDCRLVDFFEANTKKPRELIVAEDVPNWTPKECLWALMGGENLTEIEKGALVSRLEEAPHLLAWGKKHGYC